MLVRSLFFLLRQDCSEIQAVLHRGKSDLQKSHLLSSFPSDERTNSESISYFPRSLPLNFSKAPPDQHQTRKGVEFPGLQNNIY